MCVCVRTRAHTCISIYLTCLQKKTPLTGHSDCPYHLTTEGLRGGLEGGRLSLKSFFVTFEVLHLPVEQLQEAQYLMLPLPPEF